jgi:hypothetical protein
MVTEIAAPGNWLRQAGVFQFGGEFQARLRS